jgi:prepilin-type N-terminal cleavage/methylation domain-containing protein
VAPKKNKNTAGFTIIELMMVMSIIALLTVLSVGFMRDLYDNFRVAQSAEQILGLIRDAQSKAMAVEGSKAFGVEIMAKANNETLSAPINSLVYNPSGANSLTATVTSVNLDVTSIVLDRTLIDNCPSPAWPQPHKCLFTSPHPAASFDTHASNKSFVFNFTAPFGAPEYFLRDSSAATTDGTRDYCTTTQPSSYFTLAQSSTACGWLINDNFLHNYSLFHVGTVPSDTIIAGSMRSDGYYFQNSGQARIRIRYNNAERSVIIKGTGEAYIE